MKIGTNIRKIRQLRDLSQEYVVKQLGISTASYRNIETDQLDFKLSTMVRLAGLLEVSPSQFFHFNPNALLGTTHTLNSGDTAAVVGGEGNALASKERELYEQHTKLLQGQVEILSQLLIQKHGQLGQL